MQRVAQVEILVLGGTGMLGHKMFQLLRKRFSETYCTIRGSVNDPVFRNIDLFQSGNIFEHCDIMEFPMLERLLLQHKPRVVINCVGIIKQRSASKCVIPSILTNSLLPHQLSATCARWGGRLIHFSTDCVFSGKRGGYGEEDIADAEDLYGRTKFLGEVSTGNSLTLRTSIIGRELTHFQSLLEWFLSQNHRRVSGHKHALFSGVTTIQLAELVGDLIEKRADLCGLFQVVSQTISKFDLLCLLREAYQLDIELVPDEQFWCDRSMSGNKFEAATGYSCPGWPELVAQLAGDNTHYQDWRSVKHEAL
jgi:dTDP-4-dehydrorhamnose reductase